MTTLAIEINDCGLQAMRSGARNEPVLPPSPGYALLENGRILTGLEAARSARLKPRHIHHRFWLQMDRSALPPPFPSDLTVADLAHAHLSHVFKESGGQAKSVILAVTGSWSREQLALALGVARAAGMPVKGLVEAAVAAAAGSSACRRQIHLDLQLHMVVATELFLEDDLVWRNVATANGVGLADLHDRWAREIAALFIQETRFDPFHAAGSEQSLYTQLPGLCQQITKLGQAVVSMPSAGKEQAITLDKEAMSQAVSDAYEAIVRLLQPLLEGAPETALLVSHHMASLPGLVRLLHRRFNLEPTLLPALATLRGALLNRQIIQSEGE
ncbi:MAG: hypothetical protein ACE5ID_01405, partial [Acidobacteriota bacterium]